MENRLFTYITSVWKHKMDLTLTYTVPKNRPISAQHLNNGQIRIRIKCEASCVSWHFYLNHVFIQKWAVYGAIFLKHKVFFIVNYYSAAILIFNFFLPSKWVKNLKRPLCHFWTTSLNTTLSFFLTCTRSFRTWVGGLGI